MALGSIHVLSEGRPTTTLVMCPSHITHKWAREVLLTIPRARTFPVEDMRNGGEPIGLAHASTSNSFPTMAEMERAMILAAYQRSNRKGLEAARLLGIGKTTLYRKLKEFGQPNGGIGEPVSLGDDLAPQHTVCSPSSRKMLPLI
jgi:transcriptional regulator of acetoin/glycerol metabolism